MLNLKSRNEIILTLHEDKSPNNWQNVHTPYHIVDEMIELVPVNDWDYVVLFNPEFVERLINKYNVPAYKILFIADSNKESFIVKNLYNIETRVFKRGSDISKLGKLMPKSDKLVIFGNPPYQEMTGSGRQGKAIYHLFIEACKKMNPKYIAMITPSRWMQSGMAQGLKTFRNWMRESGQVKSIKHFTGTNAVFGQDTNIEGGVSYFLIDKDYNGPCEVNGTKINLTDYDIVIPDAKAFAIIDKTKILKCLNKIVLPIQPFKGLGTDFHKKWKDDGLKCYASFGRYGFVDNSDFKDTAGILGKYKVCITEATSARSVEDDDGTRSVITGYLILNPEEVCTQTWIVVNYFDSRKDAENFISYMKTKTFRFLLGMRLMVNYHTSPGSFSFVPDLQDYSHPWDDASVCAKLGITVEEFAYINSKIRDWKETDVAEEVIEDTEEVSEEE